MLVSRKWKQVFRLVFNYLKIIFQNGIRIIKKSKRHFIKKLLNNFLNFKKNRYAKRKSIKRSLYI